MWAELFHHSLRTAIIAHYLGIQLDLNESQSEDLLLDLARLDVILRLNQRRLDPLVVKALRELLQVDLHSVEHLSEPQFAPEHH